MYQSEHIFNAISNVSYFKENLIHDDVPCMQAANSAIKYDVNFNTNNADSNGFRMVQSIYKEEAEIHGTLNVLLEKGEEFVILLYTWRSCSRALPSVTANDPEMAIQIQEKTMEILKPCIAKLKEFRDFNIEAVEIFCKEVDKLCKRRKRDEFLSEAYLLAMSNVLKMFALLDEMKNMKASMKNDHTQYKRAAQHLKIIDSVDATEYSMYLAQQNVLRNDLRKRLNNISGYEEFFLDLINFCIAMYLEKGYLYQKEKHTLVLVIAFSLYLMDTANDANLNINKMKKLPISKIDQIFKECEVVNVFGDMSIYPFNFVQSTPNYDPNKWPDSTSSKISSQGVILNHISQFRSEYTCLTAELARYSNANVVHVDEDSKEKNKFAYDLALKSLQLLSKWTTQVIDTFSWKLGHLADVHINADMPQDAEDYEKATRYNYNSQEKFALIEVISMTKTIQNQLSRLECHFMQTVIPHIYMEMQTFLHITLPEIFRKVNKKKTELLVIIQSLWYVGLDKKAADSCKMNLLDKAGTLTGKKGANELSQYVEDMKIKLKSRKIPPGSTQLYLIRCILENMFQNKTKNKYKKEFDSSSLLIMEDFHKKSFYWSYLLNFGETMSICCDLSQLWYREFFLEMTNGKRIQFPIETSIPCILTNHILDTQDPAYIEYLLYPLDLYNDAAICALKKFKRQFLYNEIEAEVNFMMIQLVVRLSDQIFMYYKQIAASSLLSKTFINQVNLSERNMIRFPPPERYINIMKQRHLQLLGRSFDLCKLISHRINKSMYESLGIVVKRFKKHGITSILEFDSLIELNRLCHQNLSQYLELDDFEGILKEITQSTNSTFGNVSSFIIDEITNRICQNFSYNSGTNRYISMLKSSTQAQDITSHERSEFLWGSKTVNNCFENIFKLYNGYLGKEHIILICKYLGYDGAYWMLMKMIELCETILTGSLRSYASQLLNLMPANLSRRLDGKSSIEQYMICNDDLKKIIDIPNLTTEVSQSFNTFGNCITFLLQFENNLSIYEGLDLKQAYVFINLLPKPFVSQQSPNANEELEISKRKLNQKFSIFNVKSVLDKIGTPEQCELSKQHWELTKERLSKDHSIFKCFLYHLKNSLDKMKVVDEDNVEVNFWTRKEDDPWCYNADHEDSAFYMIWSTMLYAYSTMVIKLKSTMDEFFGEGLFWCGCTIIVLCGQQHLFEWQDICGKLMRAHKSARKDNKIESDLDVISRRIRSTLQINSRIFDILNRYMNVVDDYNYMKSLVIHLNPEDIQLSREEDDEEFED